MLEIRNVTKVYRSKTGEEVKALDNVSINFPESGMVFILGKSGSGKSTLLNVMGGLDSYDSGEFIIKGKSSNDFAGSDFDAYRNTFIGFIFQEYNVLDDFSVGANIGLALELQGKKATEEKINAILSSVDLLNYAHRKPNELSGGQKQRVAIARALVKEPQIIMADEPTGALDSNTGKQIFDTLKELSKTKLVLVVSHDRDFAERYADRIVELADGKIIEDVTKHEHQAERISDGVHRINDHILRIESGYKLTAADLEMINAYLAKAGGDVLLSGDGRVNEELRSAAGISKDGATTVFEHTQPERDVKTKKYVKDETKFIRSKLPMKNAVKMGSSGLKHKKFRLFMTIFLSFIAFAMFGLADSMAAYEKLHAAKQSVIDSNIRIAAMTVGTKYSYAYGDDDPYTYYNDAALNEMDIGYLEKETGLDFLPVYTGSQWRYDGGFSMQELMEAYSSNNVFNASLSGVVTLNAAQLAATGYQLVGRMPEAEDEIVITEFMYRQFKEYGFVNNIKEESVKKGQLTMDAAGGENSIIGKHITFKRIGHNGISDDAAPSFEVVGVLDTQFNYGRYESLLPAENEDVREDGGFLEMILSDEIRYERDYGMHALALLSEEGVQTVKSKASFNWGEPMVGTDMYINDVWSFLQIQRPDAEHPENEPTPLVEINRVAEVSQLQLLGDIIWFGGRTELGANEILISEWAMNRILPDDFELPIDAAAFEAIAVSVYGDIWAETGADNNYRYRLQQAELIYYIDHCTDEALFERIKNDYMGNPAATTDEVKTYWKENRHYFSDLIENYSAVESGYALRPQFKAYLEDLLDVTLPANVKFDNLEWFWQHFWNFGSGEQFENTIRINRDGFNWLRNAYMYHDAVEQRVWENDKIVERMLESRYVERNVYNEMSDAEKQAIVINYFENYYWEMSEQGFATYTDQQLSAISENAYVNLGNFNLEELVADLVFEVKNQEGVSLLEPDYTIVGYYKNDRISSDQPVVSNELYTYVQENRNKVNEDIYFEQEDRWEYQATHTNGDWAFAIAVLPVGQNNEAVIEKLVNLTYADESVDLLFEMQNPVMYMLGQFNEMVEILSQVFLWVGVGFAVFSAFLLMNFIATSISYKKREIGILRAVGARSSDVFKIFFSEAIIIALINFFLAAGVVFTATRLLNVYMRSAGINITLLAFGVRQIVLMLGVSVIVALLASFLPVRSIARKKPVDAIKDR